LADICWTDDKKSHLKHQMLTDFKLLLQADSAVNLQ